MTRETMTDPRYESYMGMGPKRMAHWEHWSNPDAETYLTGIDYYAHPRRCRVKLKELYPQLDLGIPETDDPKPRPEEQADQGKGWDTLKRAGKEVIFMVDGCVDAFVDDVMACGARGIISEPFTNYKAIARRYANCFIAGEGDNRVLMRNHPDEIRAMVETMVETGRMSGGYMMCIGNHIPFNVPPEAVKRYLDLSAELAHR